MESTEKVMLQVATLVYLELDILCLWNEEENKAGADLFFKVRDGFYISQSFSK
jgi:hypothetical protein